MNPEIKAKWVDALRSGQYEQGASLLMYARERAGETEVQGSGSVATVTPYDYKDGLLYMDRTPKFPLEQIAVATHAPRYSYSGSLLSRSGCSWLMLGWRVEPR